MLFFAVAAYFFLACLISWLLLFPAGRDALLHGLHSFSAHCGQVWQRWRAHYRQTWQVGGARVIGAAALSRHWLRRHVWLAVAALLVLTLPPLVAWLVSDRSMLDGFGDTAHQENLQIAELLKGEQLVPPAALPPIAFTTLEVMQVRPLLAGASRNWQLLNPDFTQRLLLIFKIMQERHGYQMAILEGYRSPERQNLLASMGPSVTNAAAFQSYHQYGLAADCAFLRDGKLVISEKDPWALRGYRLYGEVAESVGLTWGGRWKLMDFGHAELRVPGGLKQAPLPR